MLSATTTDLLFAQTTDMLSAQTTDLLSAQTKDLFLCTQHTCYPKMLFGTTRVQNRAFDASLGWFCMKFQRASFLYNHICLKSSNFNDSAPDESSGRVEAGIRHGIAIRIQSDWSHRIQTANPKKLKSQTRNTQFCFKKASISIFLIKGVQSVWCRRLVNQFWSRSHAGQ